MDGNMFLWGLIILTSVISLIGFSNPEFRNRWIYNQGLVQVDKQYYRMLSSGFLHANLLHLVLNMWVLSMFGNIVVQYFPIWQFIILYIGAILFGSLFSYSFNKNNYNYTALGASGGVTGVLIASIAINPDMPLSLIFIPIGLPAYIFTLLYMCYEVYAMIKQQDNIGHDAHIGGGFFGLLFIAIFNFDLLEANWMKLGLMVIPLLYGAYYIYNKPQKLIR